VTVFRQVQDDIRSAGGLCLDLNLTFRAHNGLLGTLNALLAPILGERMILPALMLFLSHL